MASALLSLSVHSTYRGGFEFTDNQRMALSSWASILVCSDSQESSEGNQRMRWGYRNSWRYFRTQKVLGTVMERQFPFQPLCLIHRFHLGLKFWYFSRFSLFLKSSIITMFLVNTPVKFPLPEGVIVPPLTKGWSCRWLLLDPDHCKLFCHLCLRRKRQGQGTDFTRLSQTSWNIFQHWELGKIPSMFGLGPYFFLIAEPKGNTESIYSRVIFPILIQIFLGESYLVTLS